MKTIFVIFIFFFSFASADKKPNIIFMFADDLGYRDLACYGHPYAETPNLDKLAEQGTRFNQFYVAGVTCCPSRTAFMTGVHCARFPKYPSGFGFGKQITITELLKKQGYLTAHFGKWHIGTETKGVYGIDLYDSAHVDKGFERGRDAGIYDAAAKYIKENAEKTFYMNIWGHITHYAVDAPDVLVKKYSHVKLNRSDFSKTMQHKFDESMKLNSNIDNSMREYLGELNALDTSVGKVLKALDEAGIADNTIVVFSSDHGPAPVLLGAKKESKEFSANMLGYAGELRGGKHNQYEGGVRVPFIIRWPGKVKAGRVDKQSVSSGLDWLPTLCSIAGISELPGNLNGENVSSAWLGTDRIRKTPLFWRTSSTNSRPSMREGKWKFHLGSNKTEDELYDLSNDLSESKNLASRYPEVVSKLKAKIKSWVKELPSSYKKMSKADIRKKMKK
jgi:N-acetylgalactosamine-6-sulfatase